VFGWVRMIGGCVFSIGPRFLPMAERADEREATVGWCFPRQVNPEKGEAEVGISAAPR